MAHGSNAPGLAAWLVLALACETTPTTPPRPAEPVIEPARAQENPGIAGRIRAHDGSPLRAGAFAIVRYGWRQTIAGGALDTDGRFRAELEPGLYMLYLYGVDHDAFSRVLLVTGAIEVTGSLGTHPRDEPGESLPITAELLDAEGRVLPTPPLAAARTSEGIYRVDLSARPAEAVRLRYQVHGKANRRFNGPVADHYERDGVGGYWAVIDLVDREHLEIDARRLPPSHRKPQLTWQGEERTAAELRQFHEHWTAEKKRVIGTIQVVDGARALGPAQRAELEKLAAAARDEIDAASPEARTLLRAAHFALFASFVPKDIRAAELAWFVEHVPADDPRLGVILGLDAALSFHFGVTPQLDTKLEGWMERCGREHPAPGRAIESIYTLLLLARARNDEPRIAALYAIASEPRFSGSHIQGLVSQSFAPERRLLPGSSIPSFDFPALEGTTTRVRDTDRRGLPYLLVFWATWCGPCVQEMKQIHAAYAAINGARAGKGGDAGLRRLRGVKRPTIEFVFVSFDETSEAVAKFRHDRWAMPWTNAVVSADEQDAVRQRFGSSLPAAFLVDEDGEIVEAGDALRGDEIATTLESFLAGRDR
jgi:thiol-disulfide isomerase/thioredoxin